MTEWERLKVAELKEECKARNIALTGLKLKQQYIDKLVEYESNSQAEAPAEEGQSELQTVAEKTNGAIDDVANDRKSPIDQAQVSDPIVMSDQTTQAQIDGTNEHSDKQESTQDIPLAIEADENLPADRPAALKIEDRQASVREANAEQDVPRASSEKEAEEIKKNDMLIPEPEQVELGEETTTDEQSGASDTKMDDAEESLRKTLAENAPSPTPILDAVMEEDSNMSGRSTDEDSKKRKRRSATPPPDADRITKKPKTSNGEAVTTKTALAPSSPRNALQTSETARSGAISDAGSGNSSQRNGDEERQRQEQEEPDTGNKENAERVERLPSEDKDDTVEPAIHAATRSLYLRNFKRPLNVQSLKAHITDIAKGSSSVPSNEDPIIYFTINNIRSHAFVTFSSISAASRVRAKMHSTRFPDEPLREPIFADFVPEEKVEGWVELETSGSRGSRNSGSKLEVVYDTTDDGVEAVFREVGLSKSQRPSMTGANSHSSYAVRRSSFSADPTRTASIASGIHPDRVGIVPQPTSPIDRRRSSQPLPPPQRRAENQGIGFKGLDDLFDSTTAKPKLYFKTVPQGIADDRLDLIARLHPDRGASGAPGMKRYTFEGDPGREEWVDNGPEFGHGQRGKERLEGVGGRGRGGFRGGRSRGRGYIGRDSYRGSGRR